MTPPKATSTNGSITRDTKVSLGVMLALAGAVLGGGWHMLTTVSDLAFKVERIGEDIREIKGNIKEGASDVRENTILLSTIGTKLAEARSQIDQRFSRNEARIQSLQERIKELENKKK